MTSKKLIIDGVVRLIILSSISMLVTGCFSRGTFRSNLENYTGTDASTIYLHDIAKKTEMSLSFYQFNEKKQCFEIFKEKQLTTVGMGSHRTGGIIKFTIEPNLFYAVKSMAYNYNRTHNTSNAFIPRPNKNYYVGSGAVV
nr:hypothetical protein [Morganella morganii]